MSSLQLAQLRLLHHLAQDEWDASSTDWNFEYREKFVEDMNVIEKTIKELEESEE